MPIELEIWRIDSGLKPVNFGPLDIESRLEEMVRMYFDDRFRVRTIGTGIGWPNLTMRLDLLRYDQFPATVEEEDVKQLFQWLRL